MLRNIDWWNIGFGLLAGSFVISTLIAAAGGAPIIGLILMAVGGLICILST